MAYPISPVLRALVNLKTATAMGFTPGLSQQEAQAFYIFCATWSEMWGAPQSLPGQKMNTMVDQGESHVH